MKLRDWLLVAGVFVVVVLLTFLAMQVFFFLVEDTSRAVKQGWQ